MNCFYDDLPFPWPFFSTEQFRPRNRKVVLKIFWRHGEDKDEKSGQWKNGQKKQREEIFETPFEIGSPATFKRNQGQNRWV
jgi:hypothetical protein